MGFSFIVCSFILSFIQTCAECLYVGGLVKTLQVLHMNQRHRCERLGGTEPLSRPATCVWPWHLPYLLWCFWLRKKDKTKFKWSSLCVFVCLPKSLHLAILKGGLWLNPGNQWGKNHKVWDLLTRKFPVVWQITVSHTALFIREMTVSLSTGSAASSGFFFHVPISEASVFIDWFFRFSYNLLTSCCER